MFYRLYVISDVTRRFEPSKGLEADDDRTAIALAEKLRAQRAAELWNGGRMVKEWKA